ncbi:MAG: hypothetical protein FVQ81_12275 [Candidatus Glassbacteria bacterium]|nr:hypothetical protein [Candidatus Glassbacteria bacterium]
MFKIALQFLADPTYFAGFSIIIGVAYVAVWVISLKEIVRPAPETYFRPARRDPELDIQEQRQNGQVTHRRNNSVRVRRKFVTDGDNQPRGRRVSRAA